MKLHRLHRRLAVTALALAAVLSGSIAVSAIAQAEDAAPEIMEDFQYPGAERIAAVKLISGDGNILYVECSTPAEGNLGLIKVRTTTTGNGLLCFKADGDVGVLNLEVPAVYEIRGDGLAEGAGHNITAIVRTEDGQLPPIEVDPNGSTGVGIGDPDTNTEALLLQLKVTP